MLILCKGLQRVTAEHQTRVTTGKVKELVDSLCASMDRKFHRMEYNAVLSETTIFDLRFKKLVFNDNRAVDEALQRITAAARSSQPTPLPGDQEGEGAEEDEQKEQHASHMADTSNKPPSDTSHFSAILKSHFNAGCNLSTDFLRVCDYVKST